MNTDIKKELIEGYISYGDRKVKKSESIYTSIKETQEKLRTMSKDDARENFDYNDTVAKLQALYFRSNESAYWKKHYEKYREKILSKMNGNISDSDAIQVGSVVTVTTGTEKFIILIVPEHLGVQTDDPDLTMQRLSVMTPICQQLVGRKVGDTVVVNKDNRHINYKILEVF